MSHTLTLINPLSLVGRELLIVLDEDPTLNFELRYFHTDSNKEHQITEFGGQSALVPPLQTADELDGGSLVLVASEGAEADLGIIEDFASDNPHIPIISIGNTELLGHRSVPAATACDSWPDPPWLRVAHPCLVAAQTLTSTLEVFDVKSIAITAYEPASSFGRDAVETMARQAAARLQGVTVKETVDDHIIAFSTIAVDEGQMAEDAAVLWPGKQVTVSRLLVGCFHGHVAQVAVECQQAVDHGELLEVLESQPQLDHRQSPTSVDSALDSNQVIVVPGAPSLDRTHMVFSLMLDGLRVGGAYTALQLARAVL